MTTSVTVVKSPDWDRLVKRYQGVKDQPKVVARGVVSYAQDYMVSEATHFIDTLVYKAPISASGYERTGATRRAIGKEPIQVEGNTASGVVRVDPAKANRDGFFYPVVLNRGRRGTRYYPRPFWTAARAMVQTQFKLQKLAALGKLKVMFH